MKKIFISTTLIFFILTHTMAQKEFRIPKSNGKLVLQNIANLSVEGYDGKEIIFSYPGAESDSPASKSTSNKEDPRAKGLTALGSNGFDNTGLGLNVSEKGSETFVSTTGNLSDEKLMIKLPNTVALSIKNSGWPLNISGKTSVFLHNIKSEIDMAVQYENCNLDGIAGPISIKTLGGNIVVKLNNHFNGPIYVNSVSGFIDMTVPEDLKADLSMSTPGGTIYADKSLKLQSKQVRDDKITITADTLKMDNGSITVYGAVRKDSVTGNKNGNRSVAITGVFLPGSNSNSFKGTLNGGGQRINLQTMYGKIYLRK